ncbi:hypothetical protein ACFQL1_14900 [Halomicroarcula sp. GCM10025709]|uniref:hypothetical protein n=1 Tax=Halomicroarcula sp. GCM10025709 TaxID=3252669 RepID=UPI003620DC7A
MGTRNHRFERLRGGRRHTARRHRDDGLFQHQPGEDIDVDLVAGTCTVGGTTSTFATFESSVDEPYDEIAVQKGNKFRGYVWYASTGTFSNGKTGGYPATPAVDLTYTGPQTSYNRTIVLENET